MNDTETRGTERDNPLDRGDSSDFAHKCDGCGNPTNKTPIPVRETRAEDIILCETCEVVVAGTICECYDDTEQEQ